jgi:ribosomal protein S10
MFRFPTMASLHYSPEHWSRKRFSDRSFGRYLALDSAPTRLRDVFHREVPEGIDTAARLLMVHPC